MTITADTLTFLGEHTLGTVYRYQLNTDASPPMIDVDGPRVRVGEGGVRLGIVRLLGDELTLCFGSPGARGGRGGGGGGGGLPESPDRPTEFWAEMGSSKELLVLKRIGDVAIDPDEKAIEGTWQVESNSMESLPDWKGVIERRDSAAAKRPSDDASLVWGATFAEIWPKGRMVRIKDRRILWSRPEGAAVPGRGSPPPTDPFVRFVTNSHRQPKAIDLPEPGHYATGIYRMEADRLTLCLTHPRSGSARGGASYDAKRPAGFDVPPDKDTALIVLRRVAEGAKPGTPSPVAAASPLSVKLTARQSKLTASGEADYSAPIVDTAEVGQKVLIEAAVTNRGGQAMSNIKVQVDLDPALRPVNATEGIRKERSTLSWTLAALAPGETRHFGIVCQCVRAELKTDTHVQVSSQLHGASAAALSLPIVAAGTGGGPAAPGVSPPPPPPAVPLAKAVQGTWQVVSTTQQLYPLTTGWEGTDKLEEVLKTTRVVIAADTLKFVGPNVRSAAYKYLVNGETNPAMFDVPASRVSRRILGPGAAGDRPARGRQTDVVPWLLQLGGDSAAADGLLGRSRKRPGVARAPARRRRARRSGREGDPGHVASREQLDGGVLPAFADREQRGRAKTRAPD